TRRGLWWIGVDKVKSQEAVATDVHGRVAELRAVRTQAEAGPGERATESQHRRGKLTARERIELLLDPGSFNEVQQLRRHRAAGFGLGAKKPYTGGVVTGWGMVDGGRSQRPRLRARVTALRRIVG